MIRTRAVEHFWGKYSRWNGAMFLGVLLYLYLVKQVGAARIFTLLGLLVLCVIVALGGIATAVGFHSETRLLVRAHRRERSPIRLVLQEALFGAALLVLLSMVLAAVVAFVVLVPDAFTEVWRAIKQ